MGRASALGFDHCASSDAHEIGGATLGTAAVPRSRRGAGCLGGLLRRQRRNGDPLLVGIVQAHPLDGCRGGLGDVAGWRSSDKAKLIEVGAEDGVAGAAFDRPVGFENVGRVKSDAGALPHETPRAAEPGERAGRRARRRHRVSRWRTSSRGSGYRCGCRQQDCRRHCGTPRPLGPWTATRPSLRNVSISSSSKSPSTTISSRSVVELLDIDVGGVGRAHREQQKDEDRGARCNA